MRWGGCFALAIMLCDGSATVAEAREILAHSGLRRETGDIRPESKRPDRLDAVQSCPPDCAPGQLRSLSSAAISRIDGRASAVDGRTLRFAKEGLDVTLAGIDACALPQWSFDADLRAETGDRLEPVPCGAFARAWLKRTMQDRPVNCLVKSANRSLFGRCLVGGRDLALELLRVGLAKVAADGVPDSLYRSAEKHAMAARYGMWGTYVLDMNEWRASAVDRTLRRRPIADYNLLVDRRSEISPPFADAKRLPRRTDR